MDKVFIYWDNSNIFISAQQVAIEREGEAVRSRLRIHFRNLLELARGGREIEHATAVGSGAYVSASNPTALTESTLNGATTVTLVGFTYASGVSASSFVLVIPTLSGPSISGVTSDASGSTDVTTSVAALAPTDEAPGFGSGSVSAKTYYTGTPIAEFQYPAASSGNGGQPSLPAPRDEHGGR